MCEDRDLNAELEAEKKAHMRTCMGLHEATEENERLRAALEKTVTPSSGNVFADIGFTADDYAAAIDANSRLNAENEALKHDLERYMNIANSEANEVTRLRAALEKIADPTNLDPCAYDMGEIARAALAYAPESINKDYASEHITGGKVK